MKKSSADQTT